MRPRQHRFRFRQADGRRLVRTNDGEIKTWDLARCLQEEYPANHDPVRLNVEFFIRLRNKIEHRYEKLLTVALAGKIQAYMLNYEEALVGRFGAKEGMADDLRFPIFLSSLTPDAIEVVKRAHDRLPKKLVTFIREYDAALPDEVQSDWRYDFRVLLLPQTGPKTEADAIIRFIREEDMTDEQRQARDVVQTIVRTRQVSVQNRGRHKPSAVAKQVQEQLGVKFSTYSHHLRAWQHFSVRPAWGVAKPELTDDRYCVWDEPYRDYVYTDAWIAKLVKDLADPDTFKTVTGTSPEPIEEPTQG